MGYTYEQLKQAIQDFTENTETSFVTNIPNFIQSAEDRVFGLVDLEVFRKNATSTLSVGDPYLAVPLDYLAPFSFQLTSAGVKTFLEMKDVNFLQQYNNESNASPPPPPKYYGVFDVNNFIMSPTPQTAYTVELHYYYRPLSLVEELITINLTGISGVFTPGEYVTGASSQTTAQISEVSATNIKVFPRTISGAGFLGLNVGTGAAYGTTETISGLSSAASATSAEITTPTTWLSLNAPNTLLYGSLMEAYTYMKGEGDMMQLYEQRFMQEVQRLKDLAEARENSDANRRGLPDRPRT
jgi:hypothetical protein